MLMAFANAQCLTKKPMAGNDVGLSVKNSEQIANYENMTSSMGINAIQMCTRDNILQSLTVQISQL